MQAKRITKIQRVSSLSDTHAELVVQFPEVDYPTYIPVHSDEAAHFHAEDAVTIKVAHASIDRGEEAQLAAEAETAAEEAGAEEADAESQLIENGP